jgi:hypothetical protein
VIESIPATAIRKIEELGFSVYMRNENDTYLFYTDGANIGYLQNNRLGGFSLSTVHKPSLNHGTGFVIMQGLEESSICHNILASAFVAFPDWARTMSPVRKWRDMAEYMSDNSFNSKLRLVAGRTGQ